MARPNLDRELDSLETHLPQGLVRFLRRVRRPGAVWLRVPAAFGLIAGGFVGFLPVLGFWMIPLGLALLALDLPFLRAPLARLIAWVNRKLAPQGR